MVRIVLYSRDKSLLSFLKKMLSLSGYNVVTQVKLTELFRTIEKEIPNVLIMDEVTKTISLETSLREIKRDFANLSIILLLDSVNKDKAEKLYKAGADDFVLKPIRKKALLSRIRLQMTSRAKSKLILKAGNLTMDTRKMIVRRAGKKVSLTPQEFKLLRYLLENKERVLSREMILTSVWGFTSDVESRAVDVYIGYLRNKIDKHHKNKLIKTVRGFGYKVS